MSLSAVSEFYADDAALSRPGSLAILDLGACVGFWALAVGAVVAALLLLRRCRFPDGGSWIVQLMALPQYVLCHLVAGSVPEAFSLPLIGSPGLLRGLPHLVVTSMARRYGKVFRLNAGGDRVFVIVSDIDAIRTAMTHYATPLSGKPQSTTTRMTNAGAQRDMGKRWTKRRHITMCAFKSFFRDCPDHIRTICGEELVRLVVALRESSSPAGHEPTKDITYFVARTTWRLIYGRGRQPDAGTCDQLRTLSAKIDDYTKNSGPFSLLDRFPLLKTLVSGSMARYRDAVRFMNQFCDECGAERRLHGHVDDGSRDLMTYMMRGAESITPEDESGLELTKDLLYAGVADLIRAGTESPSLLMLWVCLLLAKHQQIQEKMFAELDPYDDPEADVPTISEASLDRLPYTHAVVYETIRYCAIVPFLKRRCLSDVTIGGHTLPAGTDVIINNHAISHDAAYWRDPDAFVPERFLRDDGAFDARALENFLPFGIGKRRCMGEEIGKLLPFAALATLVLNFAISAPNPVELTPSFGITLTPQRQPLVFATRRRG